MYELSDIIIESVGLVSRAAVTAKEDDPGTNFLLLKSQEDFMPDDVTVEEVEKQDTPPVELPESPPEGWRDIIKSWFAPPKEETPTEKAEKVTKPDPKALGAAVSALRAGGYQVTAAQLGSMLSGDDEEDEMEMADNKKPPMKKDDTPMAKSDNDLAIHEIVKAEVEAIRTQYASVLGDVQKANETLTAELSKAQEEIKDLRNDRDGQKAARQKQEYLEKAASLRALPLDVETKANLLLKAANSFEAEDYKQFEALLTTTDRSLAKAKILYGEIGTALTPKQQTIEDKVAKADNPEEALLALSEDEQEELLKQWDEAGR